MSLGWGDILDDLTPDARDHVRKTVETYIESVKRQGAISFCNFLPEDNPPEALERGEMVFRIIPHFASPFVIIDTKATDVSESDILHDPDRGGDLPDHQHAAPLE